MNDKYNVYQSSPCWHTDKTLKFNWSLRHCRSFHLVNPTPHWIAVMQLSSFRITTISSLPRIVVTLAEEAVLSRGGVYGEGYKERECLFM